MSDTEKTDDLGWYTPAVLRRVLDAIERNTDPDGCGVKGYAWVKNPRLKYVNVHIDTRDMHVLFTDRDRKPVELAELMDTFAPASEPAKPAPEPVAVECEACGGHGVSYDDGPNFPIFCPACGGKGVK